MTKLFRLVFLLVVVSALSGPAAAQTTPAGEVTALLPLARVQRGNTPPGEIRLNDPVFWRDWVETEARARARLALLDGSILNVGSQARLQVLRHDQATEQTELELEFGKVRAVVKKLGRPEGRFEVRTEMAVVGVIGSHIYVDSARSLTTVINFQGSVRVHNADRSVPGEEILEPFELAEIEPGRPPRKRWATMEELLRALEDTLPGLVTRLQPQKARAGSCSPASSADSMADSDGDGMIASFPFLEIQARPCALPGLTPVRVCVPKTANPGVYEYAVPGADGVERFGAFLVQPAAPLQDAWLLYSPQLPAGATHQGRLVGRNHEPLAGVPIHIRHQGQQEVVHTHEDGSFPLQAPEKGTLELEVRRGTVAAGGSPLMDPPQPIKVEIEIVDRLEADKDLPEFKQRGTLVTVPGEVRSARLGDQTLPVLRTATRSGKTFSSFPVPRDMPEGPASLELEDPAGKRRTRRLFVYDILGGHLDQRQLMSGNKTQGWFLVCVGSTDNNKQKVRAHITAAGPVQFRGKGGQGKKFQRTFKVEPNGLLRIPFEIQAEKTGSPTPIPAVLTLRLEES